MDIESPQEGAYDQRHSETRRERDMAAAQRARENDPHAKELAALAARVRVLEEHKDNAQGANGINVNGSIVSVDPRSMRLAGSGGSINGAAYVVIMTNGVLGVLTVPGGTVYPL